MLQLFKSLPGRVRSLSRRTRCPGRAALMRATRSRCWVGRAAEDRRGPTSGRRRRVCHGAAAGTVLRDGDCFVLDEPAPSSWSRTEEPVFVVEPRTPQEWGLFAYHIGNSHQPVMLTDGEIVCADVPGDGTRARIPPHSVRARHTRVHAGWSDSGASSVATMRRDLVAALCICATACFRSAVFALGRPEKRRRPATAGRNGLRSARVDGRLTLSETLGALGGARRAGRVEARLPNGGPASFIDIDEEVHALRPSSTGRDGQPRHGGAAPEDLAADSSAPGLARDWLVRSTARASRCPWLSASSARRPRFRCSGARRIHVHAARGDRLRRRCA